MNHRSLVSNIASASMRFVTLPPGAIPWTEPPTTASGTFIPTTEKYEPTTILPTTVKPGPGFTPVAIAIAVAAPLLAILIAIAALLCCLLCCKKRKRSDKKEEALENGNAMPIYGNVNPDYHEEEPPEVRPRMPEPTYDNTQSAELMASPPDITNTDRRSAEMMVSPPDITGPDRRSAALLASAAVLAADNTRSAALMASAPESVVLYDTRTAVVVSQGGSSQEPEPNPLDAPVKAEPNTYSELPEKRNGHANGHMPGGSGLGRNNHQDSSSDEEDEIAREKRRIRELASQDDEFEYY